jgi:hypothetical protein
LYLSYNGATIVVFLVHLVLLFHFIKQVHTFLSADGVSE